MGKISRKESCESVTRGRKALQNRSNTIRNVKAAGKQKLSKTKKPASVSAQAPPIGLQFITTFDCKYYGSEMTVLDDTGKLQVPCVTMVKSAIKRNAKQHLDTLLQVTDKGVTITDKFDGNGMIKFGTEDIQRIIPGSLATKSGKRYTIAIIIEASDAGEKNHRPYHVFQFRHRVDAAHMHEASKRMWRDHMFSNLLDVSTEAAQDGFDSFIIERDIALANKRCSAIIEGDIMTTARRCTSIVESDMNFLAEFRANEAR